MDAAGTAEDAAPGGSSRGAGHAHTQRAAEQAASADEASESEASERSASAESDDDDDDEEEEEEEEEEPSLKYQRLGGSVPSLLDAGERWCGGAGRDTGGRRAGFARTAPPALARPPERCSAARRDTAALRACAWPSQPVDGRIRRPRYRRRRAQGRPFQKAQCDAR